MDTDEYRSSRDKQPLGNFYGANLTTDDVGFGNWSYENFKTALVERKYMGQTLSTAMQ